AVPPKSGPASHAEAEMLASLDLEALGKALTGTELRDALAPIFSFYNTPCESSDEREVLAHLYRALNDRPFVNLLVKAAAGHARDLGHLAMELFPSFEKSRRALEALLTLGTLARMEPDSPGLVPTRVHAMF